MNHLSDCQLILYLLLTLIETSRRNSLQSRIVLVSSYAHMAANKRFNDLQLKHMYRPHLTYAQPKLAQVMLTYRFVGSTANLIGDEWLKFIHYTREWLIQICFLLLNLCETFHSSHKCQHFE